MSGRGATYLDSSAIVKLAVLEPETTALRKHLAHRGPLVSSALARTEVIRALVHLGDSGVNRALDVLRRLDMLRVNDRVLVAAGTLLPPEVRSLDAIHLATAAQLGADLRHLVTYDERMAAVARCLGMRVESPS